MRTWSCPADLLGLQGIADVRHLSDGDLVLVLGGEDVKVAQVADLGALARLQARHDGNLLVVLAQDRDLGAVDGGGRRRGHVGVGEAGQVGAIGVDVEPVDQHFLAPVVADAGGVGRGAEDVLHLGGDVAEHPGVGRFLPG